MTLYSSPNFRNPSYGAINVHAAAGAHAPHRAREIAESISGKQRRAFERRNEKAACEMRLVVLDAVKLCTNGFGIGIKGCSQRFGNTRELCKNSDAFAGERRHGQCVKKFCTQPRVRI